MTFTFLLTKIIFFAASVFAKKIYVPHESRAGLKTKKVGNYLRYPSCTGACKLRADCVASGLIVHLTVNVFYASVKRVIN